MKSKLHIPIRSCISCRQKSAKESLLKVVCIKLLGKTECKIDNDSKLPGRGAYICKARECIELARKKNKLNRALRSNIDVNLYDQLLELCRN